MRTYERTFRSLACEGGTANRFALGFPSDCTLTRIAVRQTGGVDVPFTADLHSNALNLAPSASSADPDGDGSPPGDPDDYRVVRTVDSATPGRMLKFFLGSEGQYLNRDSQGPTNKKRRIYLTLTTEGSGPQTFDVTLACVIDVG